MTLDLSVRPTSDQLARFRRLTPAARYAWLTSLLHTTHKLAPREAKARWRAFKQAQSGGFLSVAWAFADALDRADFDAAARCSSPGCLYAAPSGIVDDVGAIIDSYRETHDWALRSFDRLRYRSDVEGVAPGVALVTYEDHIEHRGHAHVYRCRQELTIGRSKLVERIVHREIDGERRALDAFLSTVNVPRPQR